MRIGDVTNAPAVVISANATIRAAARKMVSSGADMLVVEDSGSTVGVITDRDIVTRAAARGGNPGHRKVREVMTQDLCYCFAHDDVMSAALRMEVKQIHRLAVLDRRMGLVGTVSANDLAPYTHTSTGNAYRSRTIPIGELRKRNGQKVPEE